MIFVFNKKDYNGEGEYIGRPSVLGNPYSHLENTKALFKVSSRDEAVEKFELWAREQLKSDNDFSKEFERLVDKYKKEKCLVLICWCSPSSCHGHILADLIKEKVNDL